MPWISGRKFDLNFREKIWPFDPPKRRIFFDFSSNIPHSHLPKLFPPFPSNTCPKLVGRKYIHSFQDQCCLLFKKNCLTSWPTVEDYNSQRVHSRVWVHTVTSPNSNIYNHGPMTLPCGSTFFLVRGGGLLVPACLLWSYHPLPAHTSSLKNKATFPGLDSSNREQQQ